MVFQFSVDKYFERKIFNSPVEFFIFRRIQITEKNLKCSVQLRNALFSPRFYQFGVRVESFTDVLLGIFSAVVSGSGKWNRSEKTHPDSIRTSNRQFQTYFAIPSIHIEIYLVKTHQKVSLHAFQVICCRNFSTFKFWGNIEWFHLLLKFPKVSEETECY